MPNAAYNRGKRIFADGTLGWVADDVQVLLIDDAGTYTFDPDHNFVSDLSDELSGTGYTRKSLANKSVSEDDTADEAVVHADPVTWEGIDAGDVQAIVVFKQVTDDTDSPLISYHDGGFPFSTNGGDLTVNWANTDEVVALT